jgi:hypothetical protein
MSTSERFHIPCPQCGVLVAVARAHIGKKGRCPECKTVFPISEPAAPAVADLTPLHAVPGLQPLTPGLQPLAPGLQPLAPGLQPMAGLQPLAPGLQPMQPPQQPWAGAPQQWPAQPQPPWQNAGIPNPYGQAPYGQPASPFGQPTSAFGPPSPFGQPGYGQPGYGQQHPSPFDDPSFGRPPKPVDDDLRLAQDNSPPSPTAGVTVEEVLRRANEKEGWRRDKELSDINGAMWGGLGMMGLGFGLFVVGLAFGFFTCWSPILFISGLCSFIGGLTQYFQRR